MTRKQKLYQRLLNHQKNVNFNDFIRVVEAFGFVLDRMKGSHRIYKHPAVSEEFLILQPSPKGEAKPYQIKQFLKLIEDYKLSMDGDTDESEDEDEDEDEDADHSDK